jgi:hypothetical protein
MEKEESMDAEVTHHRDFGEDVRLDARRNGKELWWARQ